MSDLHKYADALDRQQAERERSPVPVPRRITMALDLAGLHGPGVDAALGVPEPTVDQWESGELVPTAEQLVALARLTGQAVGWFFRPVRLELAGPGWVCQRGSPGKGCQRVQVGLRPAVHDAARANPGRP
uniref:hypothetical protein n=1 Tax=Nonomuraea sp. CA-251285 TaxID=3240002 RepID=UPI003F49B3EB